MKTLREKLKKQGGFTMVEMLIVVAIIAILMAVSIPMFNNALEKARHGVDAANNRDAISLANAEAIASLNPAKEFATPQTYYYTVDEQDNQGALITTKPADDALVKPQCTTDKTKATLRVQITYNASASDPLKVFEIKTNWEFDDNGHVKSKVDFS